MMSHVIDFARELLQHPSVFSTLEVTESPKPMKRHGSCTHVYFMPFIYLAV